MKSKLQEFEFHIITMSTYGVGLSGGDRIWIELSKRLAKKYPVYVYAWEEGEHIAKREGLENGKYVLWSAKFFNQFGFFVNYFARIIIAIWKSLNLKVENSPKVIVYSASEFWQDSLPALLLKLRYPKIKWIAAWYQTAPNPLRGFSEDGESTRFRFKAWLYWLVQFPIQPAIKQFANFVFITSEPDRSQFVNQEGLGKSLVIKGGVDLAKIKAFKSKNKLNKKIYDAVFQGRLHPQKGVLELIDIWKLVVKKRPNSRLAIIGDGPLMKNLKNKISKEKLERNIDLFGYVFDGEKKYKIFSQSKIVLHPAFYDSGGMAAAEAMAFGLPGIAFDLESLKSYYPSGMIKIRLGDLNEFAKKIIELLTQQELYKKKQKEALALIENYWNWDLVVNRIEKMLD